MSWITNKVCLITLLAGIGLAGCRDKEEQHVDEPSKVEVVTVQHESLQLSAELPGRLEPVRIAEVRARVAGIVLHKRFEEGAEVKAGDLLYQIDPAPLQAAVSRAEAQLARAEAAFFEAQARARRYKALIKSEAVSQQDYDSAHASMLSAEADRRSAHADLETARLNLSYALVKAPISGRIGRALVTEGALVGQGETTLMARIQQLDPIYADFTQPVSDALKLRDALSQGRLTESSRDTALTLKVEGIDHEISGKLLFRDVSVERSTGQLSLRGEFNNAEGVLLPGMYVRIRTPQGQDEQAILLPQRAVQRDSVGAAQVWVVGPENKVESRPVETGVMDGSRWQIIRGLKAGEKVVVGGFNRLSAGAVVDPQPVKKQPETSQ